MLLRTVFLVCMQYQSVFLYQHKKPLATTIWPAGCLANQRVLNDCNWCVCKDAKFSCRARVCHEVDMFGHFNDAIQEHIVGMEGHGSWRSTDTPCSPRAHYQREGLLCVCDDDGGWPSPVCRDLFRAMHQVEVTGHARPSALHECTPHRLYLYGCDVCLCPPAGRVDPAACTRHNCSADDPVLLPPHHIKLKEEKYDLSEVYAECELDRKYIFGCRKCICLKNNRLLCDNCEKEVDRSDKENNHCARLEHKQPFNVDCNTCVCDERNLMYCTTRRCLKDAPKPSVELSKSVDLTLRSVEPPLDSLNCILGTKYREDCNTCFCTETADGQKVLSCTRTQCRARKRDSLLAIQNDCVENTVYEKDCQVCRCDELDGVRRESCLLSAACGGEGAARGERADLDAMHGYCEPAHEYRKDCNTCRCLADGKTAACTALVCAPQRPLEVDVVPVRQRRATPCPKDHMYKVDCNFCFCLSNGNFLCTTAECDEQ